MLEYLCSEEGSALRPLVEIRRNGWLSQVTEPRRKGPSMSRQAWQSIVGCILALGGVSMMLGCEEADLNQSQGEIYNCGTMKIGLCDLLKLLHLYLEDYPTPPLEIFPNAHFTLVSV